MAKEPVGNGVSHSEGEIPQNRTRESTVEASQNLSRTETAKAPSAQSQTSAASRASRTPRADARYQELLAQAREIMANPEFMEEVMALARLQCQIEKELKKLLGHSALSSSVSEMLVLGLRGGRKRG